LSPIEDLSAIAKSLGCKIVIKSSEDSDILATIEPSTYEKVSESLLVSGDTSITGTVERVGGATDTRCALRVDFQPNLLYCGVATKEVARKLGERLYQSVVVTGTAHWLRGNWRVMRFRINEMYQPIATNLLEAVQEIRKAGGSGWDKIGNPAKFLREVGGDN
jgi:hypothetical protein